MGCLYWTVRSRNNKIVLRAKIELPHSGAHTTGGLARELSGDKYGKRLSEKAGDNDDEATQVWRGQPRNVQLLRL